MKTPLAAVRPAVWPVWMRLPTASSSTRRMPEKSPRTACSLPTLLKYLTRPGMSRTDILMNTRRDVRQASGNRQRPGEYSMLETDIYLAGVSGSPSARPNAPSFNLEQSYGGKSESKTITVQENRSLAVAFSWVERPDVPDGYVLVEGGTFRMGSPSSEDGRDDDEGPQHSVTVGFFLYEGDRGDRRRISSLCAG